MFFRIPDHDTVIFIMAVATIQIRNPDLVRDIRALAGRLGLPLTDVIADIADAIRRRLAEAVGREADAQAAARRRVVDVLARIDALAVTGPILTDDDLYGLDGLPR